MQTGRKPVDVRPSRHLSENPLTKTLLVSFLRPTKKYWSLFGSRVSKLIDKTDRPRQCETCWDYHPDRVCNRQPPCRRYGKTGHTPDDCAAPEQCVNCLGPHEANFHKCPAGPKKIHVVFRRLTKEQREHVRAVGAEIYRQRNPGPRLEPQRRVSEPQQSDISPSQEQLDTHVSSPAASRAPSCIMVATTSEAEEEPDHPRPGRLVHQESAA
jgi:hypothetical protein